MLALTLLTFLGGAFYSLSMLPQPWRSVALANPVVTQVNGLRWTFHGHSDVDIRISAALTLGLLAVCTMVIAAIFRTGYRLRS